MAHHHPGAGGKGVMNRFALVEMAARAYLCIMKLKLASITDYASVLSFYDDVTEHTPEIERFARWQKGKHPTAEGIKAYIQEGSFSRVFVSYFPMQQDVNFPKLFPHTISIIDYQ